MKTPSEELDEDAELSDNIIELDLNQVELFGYEDCVDECIDSIIQGIEAGETFTPVHVARLDQNKYLLLMPHGGHHRAVGHYIENKPLRCVVVDPNAIVPGYTVPWQFFIDSIFRGSWGEVKKISDAKIIEDKRRAAIKRKAYPKYIKPSS